MKSPTLVFVIALLAAQTGHVQSIPSSSRSREAIARVTPLLEQEFADARLTWGANIFMRIFKAENELEVWIEHEGHFRLLKIYPICTYGSGDLGPKIRQGDNQAPEGFYFVTPNQLNPSSSFHLSFNLGYPNRYDRYHGRTGGALMVHGSCVSIGCYAMTNEKIEEIYTIADAAFRKGQSFFRIHIFPFRMTDENMQAHLNDVWIEFWQNLKEGYDFFAENENIPPNVEIRNGRYVFQLP